MHPNFLKNRIDTTTEELFIRMKESDQLFSCPFCGSPAAIMQENNKKAERSFLVGCTDEFCGLDWQEALPGFSTNTIGQAVRAWNKRADVPKQHVREVKVLNYDIGSKDSTWWEQLQTVKSQEAFIAFDLHNERMFQLEILDNRIVGRFHNEADAKFIARALIAAGQAK
jgi:hypothetical protein